MPCLSPMERPQSRVLFRCPLSHTSPQSSHLQLTIQATYLPRAELMVQSRFGTSEAAMSLTLSMDMEVLCLLYVCSKRTRRPTVLTIQGRSEKANEKVRLKRTTK